MLASERRGIHQMSLAPWDALSMRPRWCAPGQAVWGGQDSPKQGVAAGSPAFSWTPSLWGLGLEVKGKRGYVILSTATKALPFRSVPPLGWARRSLAHGAVRSLRPCVSCLWGLTWRIPMGL